MLLVRTFCDYNNFYLSLFTFLVETFYSNKTLLDLPCALRTNFILQIFQIYTMHINTMVA